MQTRICSSCGQEKPLDKKHFHIRKDRKGVPNYRRQCIDCTRAGSKNWASLHKDQKYAYDKQYRDTHKEDMAAYQKLWRASNKELTKQYDLKSRTKNKTQRATRRRQRYQTNKEKELIRARAYRATHPEQRIAYQQRNRQKINAWRRKKRQQDRINRPDEKIRENASNAIRKALKTAGTSKAGQSILKFLPYTITVLMAHIESLWDPWMNWGNYGKYNKKTWKDDDPTTWTWQLDHIIPHSEFHYTTMDCQEFRNCWALSNLRPFSAKQNLLDGVRRTRHKLKPSK